VDRFRYFMTGKQILALKMGPNDADAETVRDYLKALLSKVVEEGEEFSGKRPFGNSGWEDDLRDAIRDTDAGRTPWREAMLAAIKAMA
jgi:hypothetical protein